MIFWWILKYHEPVFIPNTPRNCAISYTNAKSTGLKFCRVDALQELRRVIVVMMSPQQHTCYQSSTFLKWKMPYLLLQSLRDFHVLVLCNVHIHSHPLNEQQEQITLLEGRKLWFYFLNGQGLEPIVLPWKCQSGHIMELCDECNNCTKFSSIQKKSSEIFHFLWFYIIVSTLWRHKSSNLNKSKS